MVLRKRFMISPWCWACAVREKCSARPGWLATKRAMMQTWVEGSQRGPLISSSVKVGQGLWLSLPGSVVDGGKKPGQGSPPVDLDKPTSSPRECLLPPFSLPPSGSPLPRDQIQCLFPKQMTKRGLFFFLLPTLFKNLLIHWRNNIVPTSNANPKSKVHLP